MLFALLDQFPLAEINAVIVMVLIVLWFVSGADAASVVMGILCSRGSANPPRLLTAFWGIVSAVAAAVLLLAGGLDRPGTGHGRHVRTLHDRHGDLDGGPVEAAARGAAAGD